VKTPDHVFFIINFNDFFIFQFSHFFFVIGWLAIDLPTYENDIRAYKCMCLIIYYYYPYYYNDDHVRSSAFVFSFFLFEFICTR